MLTKLTNGMKIGKATVVVDIIGKSNPKIRPGNKMNPSFITYHNTGNAGRGANAVMHNRYIHNMASYDPKDTSHVSWHLTVDDNYIYQHIPFNENAWHCGDGSTPRSGNMTSIGIEICMHQDQKDYHQAEENAIALGVYLAKELGISDSNHVPHQKWSGKYCPAVILRRDNGFTKFHNRIKSVILSGQKAAVSTPAKTPAPVVAVSKPTGSPIGTVKISVANLNVRSEASFNSAIVDVVKKNQTFDVYETKNGLHRIQTGWVSAGTTYTKFTKKSGSSASTSANDVIGTAEILVGMLNVRQSASFSSKAIGVARKGQKFDVYETKSGLHRIKSGWISAGKSYTKFTKKSAPKAADKVIGTAEVLVGMLNIRSAANFNSGVVGVANKGQRFNVFETKSGLHRIGNGRWISAGSKYTKFVKASASSAPKATGKGNMKTTSIVDYLKSINVDSSYSNRKKLAAKHGIKNYSGKPSQNTELLKKIRGS